MLLEHDFQLIEPGTCVVEQLVAGTALLDSGRASVIRFRHRTAPGRPEMGFGLEGGFPRYACLVYPWTAHAETAFSAQPAGIAAGRTTPLDSPRVVAARAYAEGVRNEDTTRDLENSHDRARRASTTRSSVAATL